MLQLSRQERLGTLVDKMRDPWTYAASGTEFANQVALFMWANMARTFGLQAANCKPAYSTAGLAQAWLTEHNDRLPQLQWLHAVKNQGHGDAIRGARSAAEGVKAGVFDTFLPVARSWQWGSQPPFQIGQDNPLQCQYNGLYIELKRPGKHKASAEQETFQRDMRAAGYAAEICVGWEAARDCILKYLGKA